MSILQGMFLAAGLSMVAWAIEVEFAIDFSNWMFVGFGLIAASAVGDE